MQEVRIGLHHASEVPGRFLAGLVGGR